MFCFTIPYSTIGQFKPERLANPSHLPCCLGNVVPEYCLDWESEEMFLQGGQILHNTWILQHTDWNTTVTHRYQTAHKVLDKITHPWLGCNRSWWQIDRESPQLLSVFTVLTAHLNREPICCSACRVTAVHFKFIVRNDFVIAWISRYYLNTGSGFANTCLLQTASNLTAITNTNKGWGSSVSVPVFITRGQIFTAAPLSADLDYELAC